MVKGFLFFHILIKFIAMTLCTGNKKVFEKDIALSVLRAKKLLWYK